jgi:hypothetical protein
MKDILTAPFMVEMIRTATNMYAHGWDERNGGNISLMLEENEVREYLDPEKALRTTPTGFAAPELEEDGPVVADDHHDAGQHGAFQPPGDQLTDPAGEQRLGHIAQEHQDSVPEPHDAQGVGGAGVFAAHLPEVGLVAELRQHEACGQRTEQIRDQGRQDITQNRTHRFYASLVFSRMMKRSGVPVKSKVFRK